MTVCEDAGCPNLSECWADGTATFMVLGDRCTRACGFCLVDTRRPEAPASDEPDRVAEAIDRMGLDHAVLTMVARDDLDDGGMAHVAACVRAIRARRPGTRVETLISDVRGSESSLEVLFAERPDVLNHNIETVARLQRAVRPSAGYARSLSVLARAKAAGLTTKSGLIVGMGETDEEVDGAASPTSPGSASTSSRSASTCARRRTTCPSSAGSSRRRSRAWKAAGEALGIRHVEASPLTRSSYHAKSAADRATAGRRLAPMTAQIYLDRLDRVRAAMAEQGVDVLLLSVGHDLPYLTGYQAMPLERLTMLVVPRDGDATMVIPRLEAPRVVEQPGVFGAAAVGRDRGSVGDRRRARRRGAARPPSATRCGPGSSSSCCRGCRAPSSAGPSTSSARCAWSRTPPRSTRCGPPARPPTGSPASCTPARSRSSGAPRPQVSADISARLLAEGHDKVNFAIVAAGENAASPHHHAGDRVIRDGEIVLCDFGGTMAGYCSDTTRCVFTGAPPAEIADAYAVLHEAQQASVAAAVVGTPCQDVDRVGRRIIADAGFGDHFVHRTGHGIGMEEHEDPYIVEGNERPLAAGHAFSVEPGIYVPGRWGMRLEDIVVATDAGPEPLNASDHALVSV